MVLSDYMLSPKVAYWDGRYWDIYQEAINFFSKKKKKKKETVTIAFNKSVLHIHEIVQVYNNCFSLFNHAVH